MRVEAVSDFLITVKTVIAAVSGFLLAAAFRLEPDAGAWVAAFAGSFFAASLSSDKRLGQFVAHLGIGVVIGLTLAQMIEWGWRAPRVPVSVISASLGYALHSYLTATIVAGKLFETIAQALAALLGRGGSK